MFDSNSYQDSNATFERHDQIETSLDCESQLTRVTDSTTSSNKPVDLNQKIPKTTTAKGNPHHVVRWAILLLYNSASASWATAKESETERGERIEVLVVGGRGYANMAWANPNFQRLLAHGLYWAAKRDPKEIPAGK